jgi:curved DNA-binding protein CbpA
MVSSIESLQTFDPFQVLDIPVDADMKTIKRAFRN